MKNNIGLNKRKLTWIVSKTVLLFIFCGLSSNPMCAYAGSDDVWYWKKNYVGALTGYGGSSKTPVVPSIVTNSDGASWNVTWLFETFKGNSNITAVTLTAGIRTLTWAFQDCVNLSHVTIQGDTINLGIYSFKGCASLQDIDFLPASVTSIGQSAFAGCTGLKTLNLPTALTNLDIGAFGGCTSLTSIRTSPPLQRMGGTAPSGDLAGGQFARCTNLRQAWIDGDGLLLPHGMLGYCSNLEEVVIGDGAIGVYVDSSSRKVQYAQPFVGDTKLRNLTVGTGITNIPPGFCSNLTGLCSAAFHGFRDTIGQSAFQGCSSLTNLELGSTWTPERVEALTFAGCQKLSANVVFSKCTSIGWGAFSNCLSWSFGNVDIPLVTDLGWGAFANCNGLTSLTLGKGMTNIEQQALTGCMGLEKISVDKDNPVYASDKGVLFSKDMGSILLYPKGKKGAYVIPNSVTNLSNVAKIAGSNYPFRDCINLTSVTIPRGVEYIGRAFDGCINLSNIWFKGDVPNATPMSFTNVAPGAIGYYAAAYSAEWRAAITNGMWCGLIMEEEKVPSCELRIARADPAAGSLTLAWEETVPVEGVTYSVYRSANDTYSATDLVTNGLTRTTWTDTAYWSAEPVLKPLNYWVVADGGGYGERVSNREETRHRYALGVGVGRYRDEDTWEPDVSDITNADLFKRLTDEGGFTTAVLSGSKATHEGIREQMRDLSSKAKTGDYLFVFCSSHGKTSWWRALAEAAGTTSLLEFQGVAMYDTVDKVYTFDHIYAPDEIKADLEACLADKNGVSLVFILNCCMSGGVTAYSPSNGDMAWITSCQEKALTPTWPRIGTPLPKYFFDYGWQQGMAGDTEYLTLANLLDYALPQLEVFFSKVNEHNTPVVRGRGILEHFIVGQPGNATHTSEPDVPTGLSASLSGKELTVQWNNDTKADYFIVRRTNATGDNNPLVYVGSGSSEVFSFQDKEASWFGTPYLYRVAAMNEWGISEWSDPRLGACMWKEWMDWIGPYFGFEEVSPEDLAAAAIATSANGATYATCYVAGLDPNDPNAAFTAELVREDGKWKAKPKGGEKEGRVYRVEGKKEMSDETWTDVTTVDDLEAEGWHFFRVGVELAE